MRSSITAGPDGICGQGPILLIGCDAWTFLGLPEWE